MRFLRRSSAVLPRRATIVVACTVLLLAGIGSGCATVVPQYDLPTDRYGAPTAASIVSKIRCELSRLVDGSYPNETYLIEQDIDVAAQLSLTINDTGSLAPTLTYIGDPTFSFGGSALLSSSREQNFTEKLYFSMRDLKRDLGRNAGTPSDPRLCGAPDTNLAGDLGIRGMVDLAISSPYVNNSVKLSGIDGAFGGYIKFAVNKNVNSVGPTWMLTHFRGPGGFLGASEVNTDQLTIAFARGDNHGTPFNPVRPEKPKVRAAAERLLETIIFTQIATQIRTLR